MYLGLPLIFLKFWFVETPRGLILFFASLNSAFLQLFSLPLLTKTYFRPWKNEYRKGLVGFSVAMGIIIKTAVIIVDALLFFILLIGEIVFTVSFVLWPIGALLLLFLR
ncbi:MAG: hypothetical protein HY424_01365 [Candidatus Levybacteria bacterium]|nr:hypothetical protein [Candidatus Levybacteria bacterium]